jgi:hypothetical protein
VPSGKDEGKQAYFDKITENQWDLEKSAEYPELIFLSLID